MAIWENNLFKTIISVATSRATLWKIVLLLVLHLVTLSFCLQVSRTLRRELEHFDVVMKDEFEVAFGAYRSSYWRSLQVNAHLCCELL